MLLSKQTIKAALVLSASLSAPNVLAFKNITDYEYPFIMYQKLSSAQTFTKANLKVANSDGKTKDKFSMSVERYVLGLHRERYDDNFGYIGLLYAEGKSDSKDYAFQPKMKEQFGFIYSNGVHITKRVDWSLSIELSTSKFYLEGKNKSKLGAGLGTELVFKPIEHLQLGALLLVSSQYMGGGLSLRLQY